MGIQEMVVALVGSRLAVDVIGRVAPLFTEINPQECCTWLQSHSLHYVKSSGFGKQSQEPSILNVQHLAMFSAFNKELNKFFSHVHYFTSGTPAWIHSFNLVWTWPMFATSDFIFLGLFCTKQTPNRKNFIQEIPNLFLVEIHVKLYSNS